MSALQAPEVNFSCALADFFRSLFPGVPEAPSRTRLRRLDWDFQKRHKSMLRDWNLIPLSRQHQHVLALCVRLDRAIQAGAIDLESWQAEIQEHFDQEVCIHFTAEEQVLFPVVGQVAELRATVDELRAEHVALRALFAQAEQRSLEPISLADFVERLARHIRKEERELFEGMQKLMTAEQLSTLGVGLNEALKQATQRCSLPRKSSM